MIKKIKKLNIFKKGPAQYRRCKPSGSGFVILFAVTLAALLLSIALGVANIALKEIKFGTSARDTNDAFFAADTGVECALFNDKGAASSFGGSGGSSIQCSGNSVAISGSSPVWNFIVPGLGSTGASCANVTVDKSSGTTITSKGYNIGNASCNSTNPNRVERELVTTYGGGSSSSPSLNLDFETGSVGSCPSNWTCTGDAVIASSSDGQGCGSAGGINGSQYLKAGCDGTMGTARSQTFTLPSGIDHVRALRAGGADAGSGWYVKQASDGTNLCATENGTDADTFFVDNCTGLTGKGGTSVYIYVIDNQNSGWGKVYLDNIQLMDSSNNVLSPGGGAPPSGVDGTGGTITHSGGYTIHTFTSSGTFNPGVSINNVEVLVVASGGGGGGRHGGGGGAGGLIYNPSFAVTAQDYTSTIGVGGVGGNYNGGGLLPAGKGGNGSNSTFSTLTAIGGGGGSTYDGSGSVGGSGGGGAGANSTSGVTGTSGQGNTGGNGGSNPSGGGGGGAGAVGSNATSNGGAGGVGLAYSISGSSVYYAGGGGGGGDLGFIGGNGGGGGGGHGGDNGANANQTTGTANTGGGGGGTRSINNELGSAGGSGIVIIRYSTPGGGGGGGGGSATHFAVVANPSSVTAGSQSTNGLTVTAQDSSNNTVTGYSGTVNFSGGGGSAILPSNGSSLSNGVGTFSFTLNTSGTQTITATDSANGTISGTSNSITVSSSMNGFTYRRVITIPAAQISNSVPANFTVLVNATLNAAHVQNSSGYDIVFTSGADCTSPLSWEMEKYAYSTGEMVAWIKMPFALNNSSNSTFYMCYGKSSISSFQGGAVGSAWDANYKGVWHLPNGTSLTTGDSTSNGETLTNDGSVPAITGKIDGGASFNGSNQDLKNNSGSAVNFSNVVTMEAWFKKSGASSQGPLVQTENTGGGGYGLSSGSIPGYCSSGQFQLVSPGIYNTCLNGNPADTNWHHIVATISNVTGRKVYVDGTLTGSDPATNAFNGSGTQTFYIGAGGYYADGGFFAGSLDEVRVSNIERSADWAKTEYNNQSNPSTVGAEQ